jgi:hypothetical protein
LLGDLANYLRQLETFYLERNKNAPMFTDAGWDPVLAQKLKDLERLMKDEVDDTLDGTDFRAESARIVEVENGKPDKEYRASVQIRINGDDSVGAIGTISRTMTFPFRKDAKADEPAEKTVSQMHPYGKD